jgi:F-type H+-transporting ATPase subunit gamma
MALKDIKAKILATKRMNTVTRAMEAVSAAKMRKTQEMAFAGRPYARAALSILTRIAGTEEVKRHPLAHSRPVKRIAMLVITSDRGLAGSLNSGVLKKADESLSDCDLTQAVIYAYGKKGHEHFAHRGYTSAKVYENREDEISLSAMEEISRELSEKFLAGEFDKVLAVYSNFHSTFEQVPTMRRVLPISFPALTEIVEGIRPAKGKWSREAIVEAPAAYTVEAERDDILNILIPRLIGISFYYMLLEAKASEHSARMVAMKNASDKSRERTRELTRLYNKLRQAAITREVSEIVGGREALSV